MQLTMRHSAFLLLVNIAAISGKVNELATLIAAIGSFQKCDIQVTATFLMASESALIYLYALIDCIQFKRSTLKRIDQWSVGKFGGFEQICWSI